MLFPDMRSLWIFRTIRDTTHRSLSGKLNVEINAYENVISSQYKVYSSDGTEAFLEKKIKKPGKTEMLDLNKSGLLDGRSRCWKLF